MSNAKNGDRSYDLINDYGAVRINLASPHDIRNWSFGEVKKPETINYRTYRPEKDGLFCERIFGPEKDWECSCGKYCGLKYKGMICDCCGVKVAHSSVRRKRMGHIELAAPVAHFSFFKAMPSLLGTLLDMKTSSLKKVIYFQAYVVTDPGETYLRTSQILTEYQYYKYRDRYGNSFKVEIGAEAIRNLLSNLNMVDLSISLRYRLDCEEKSYSPNRQIIRDLVERLKVVEAIRDSGLGGPQNKPEWMVLECVPVIPPDFRPLVMFDCGNFAISELNHLYMRIINRNNRLKKLMELKSPEVIIQNEKRQLQQSVDSLFDNSRTKEPMLGSSNKPIRSFTDMINGKHGFFRQNLQGKRVDFSARSVIVVGPKLKLHQCGLPKKIALELYQPFVIRRLRELGHADTEKSATKMIKRKDEHISDILEEVINNHPILLSRRPTLNRMGIQAFEPVIVEGNAIQVHPLVCKGLNVNFDGDQMAVHLPLSIEAQVEASVLMMSTNNIFSPANGQPIISPSQDIVMGCCYLTSTRGEMGESGESGEGKSFASVKEVFTAFDLLTIGMHARIHVRLPIYKKFISETRFEKNKTKIEELPRKSNGLVTTTVGRVIFNNILDARMAFYDLALSTKNLSRIVSECYQALGKRATIELLDRIKEIGFHESTRSGLSFATDDLRTPDTKEKILIEAEKDVEKIHKNYDKGNITERERYNNVIGLWANASKAITKQMVEDLRNDTRPDEQGKKRPYLNPVFLMTHSGASGSIQHIGQLAGMRGLIAKPNGTIIETPIKANFKEGLSVLEYFSSTYAARKSFAITALKGEEFDYFARTLADVAQNVVITMHDCATSSGINKSAILKGEETELSLAETIRGRVSRATILNPVTGETIVEENDMISTEAAQKLEHYGIDKITVRSPMTCLAPLGICRLCYGMDLSTGSLVEEGMAVGIIAAQSISGPVRKFRIGGVVKRKVGESEHRAKKFGTVSHERIDIVINDKREKIALTLNGEISILGPKDKVLETYAVPNGSVLFVEKGQQVVPGQILCKWDPNNFPIIADRGGKITFDDIVEGETFRKESDETTGAERLVIMEHYGELHPQVFIEDEYGQKLMLYYMPEKAVLEVREGQIVSTGAILAKTPCEVVGTQDITGGLLRITEIFEARRPRDPAVLAEVAGVIEIGDKRRGKRSIWVVPIDDHGNPSGTKIEHLVPPGKHLRVHAGDRVREGDALVQGPLDPHGILRIIGTEAAQAYLVREIQAVYRAQRVGIDDKHIEIIVSQMLRKVKVEKMGDTRLLKGSVIDRFAFQHVNQRLRECLKIKKIGDSRFEEGEIIAKDVFEEERALLEADDKVLPTFTKPEPATCSTQLLGITRASVESDSFISAASFLETTKVLAEAALAGKVDYLVGLKENVIFGHLIPAGTGFSDHQNSEIKVNSPYVDESSGNILSESDDDEVFFN